MTCLVPRPLCWTWANEIITTQRLPRRTDKPNIPLFFTYFNHCYFFHKLTYSSTCKTGRPAQPYSPQEQTTDGRKDIGFVTLWRSVLLSYQCASLSAWWADVTMTLSRRTAIIMTCTRRRRSVDFNDYYTIHSLAIIVHAVQLITSSSCGRYCRFSPTELQYDCTMPVRLRCFIKQGVALTGRNTTGPPRAAPGELRCICECYRRRQTSASY